MPFEGRRTAPDGIVTPKTYYPSLEEFTNFSKFIDKIEAEDSAHLAGICKIVPPKEWIPRKSGYDLESLNFMIETPIKQKFKQIGDAPGVYQAKSVIQPKMEVLDYAKMTASKKYEPPKHQNYEELERKYWELLDFSPPPVYGCDVANSISDPELTEWNIAKLNTILDMVNDELDVVIQGVNSPYLYFGMWKATFSWHVEDMDLYGINMVHHGAPKTWYCVPPKYGHKLEKLCKELFPHLAAFCSNFMRHKTCMLAPYVLEKYGIPCQKMVQEERDIIIVFPYAYHSGFNHGFNIAESTNFASPRWIEYGKRHRPCDCDNSRVKFSMDPFVKKFQSEKYTLWLQNLDIAPHPEDPPDIAKEIYLRAENPSEYARQLEMKVEQPESTPEVASDEMVLHVYKHVEFTHLEVAICPATFRIHRGKSNLMSFLARTKRINMRQLIKDGVFYKTGIEVTKKPTVTEQKLAIIYTHVSRDDILVSVDPLTFALIGDNSDKTLEVLNETKESIPQLIELGVLVKLCSTVIDIQKEIVRAPISISSSPAKLKKPTSTQQPKEVHVYYVKFTGDLVKISHSNLVIGKRSEKKLSSYLAGNKSVADLIDEGTIVKVGKQGVRQLDDDEIITEEPKKIEKPNTYPTFVYEHQGTGDRIILTHHLKIKGRRSDRTQQLLGGKTVHQLISEGVLVKVQENPQGSPAGKRAKMSKPKEDGKEEDIPQQQQEQHQFHNPIVNTSSSSYVSQDNSVQSHQFYDQGHHHNNHQHYNNAGYGWGYHHEYNNHNLAYNNTAESYPPNHGNFTPYSDMPPLQELHNPLANVPISHNYESHMNMEQQQQQQQQHFF